MGELRKVNTVDAIIEGMMNKIEAGEYNPGERIPSEKVLAKEFNVSRTSLREAFKKLEIMGTITIRQGDGTYLNDNSQDSSKDNLVNTWLRSIFTIGDNNLMDYLEAREMIEIQAAKLAAKRATAEDIEKISSILSAQDTADPAQHSKIDFEFHQAVVYAAHNTCISKIWDLLSPLIAEQQARSNYIAGVTDSAFSTHKLLLEAIAGKKSKSAEKIMAEHLSLIPGRLFNEATKKYAEERDKTE
jgi:Transcriptional regulators